MGQQLEGIEFSLATVTAATDLATMLHPTTGSVCPYTFTIDANSDIFDVTGQGDTAKRQRSGLGQWTARAQAWFPRATKLLGNNGDITWSDATDIKWIQGYSLNVETDQVHDISSQDQANKNFKYFRPSKLVKFGGDIDAMYDSATAAIIPVNASTATVALCDVV